MIVPFVLFCCCIKVDLCDEKILCEKIELFNDNSKTKIFYFEFFSFEKFRRLVKLP